MNNQSIQYTSSLGYLPEIPTLLIVIGFFIPISIISIRGIYLQLNYMIYPGLRSPVVILFFGSILFQTCSIISLCVSPMYDIIASTIEKIYMAYMLYTFFNLMREFVFFETLFKTDCA